MSTKFSLFKTPGHQRFEYTPLYYDALKEEMNERLKRQKQKENGEDSRQYHRMKLSNDFKSMKRKTLSYSNKERSKSRIRFIIILLFLSYLCYRFFTSFS